ncbi:MAG: RHS repeat-associated core domain-containing protein [Armatimonadetes bacterium]|nr:RHS repeat-associated core domain-containing protein [Armatimonadota bacterium]
MSSNGRVDGSGDLPDGAVTDSAYDGANRLRELVNKDPSGDVLAAYGETRFLPTGDLASWTAAISGQGPHGYRAKYGYYTDQETGLVALAYRYYEPGVGRFLNRDPVFVSAALYRYCGDSPVALVDPAGLLTILDALVIGAFAGAIGTLCARRCSGRQASWEDVLKGSITGMLGSLIGNSFATGGLDQALAEAVVAFAAGVVQFGIDVMQTGDIGTFSGNVAEAGTALLEEVFALAAGTMSTAVVILALGSAASGAAVGSALVALSAAIAQCLTRDAVHGDV